MCGFGMTDPPGRSAHPNLGALRVAWAMFRLVLTVTILAGAILAATSLSFGISGIFDGGLGWNVGPVVALLMGIAFVTAMIWSCLLTHRSSLAVGGVAATAVVVTTPYLASIPDAMPSVEWTSQAIVAMIMAVGLLAWTPLTGRIAWGIGRRIRRRERGVA